MIKNYNDFLNEANPPYMKSGINDEGIKRGDTVICLKKPNDFLDFGIGLMNFVPNHITVGNKYKVVGFISGYLKIRDDSGNINAYSISNFTKDEQKYKDYIRKKDNMKIVDPYGEEDWD